MRPSALLLSLVAGCGITAESGQFTCPDGRCPSGLTCVSGVCVTPGGTVDVGPRDAPVPDVPGLDAPDAFERPDGGAPESCEPDPASGAARDEDLDGAIDEDCTLSYGPHHIVLPAMVTRDDNYIGMELVDTGLTGVYTEATLDYDRPIRTITRSSIIGEFDTPGTLAGTNIPAVASYTVTVNGAGTHLVITGLDATFAFHLYESNGRLDTGTFTPPTIIAELETVETFQGFASLSRDGLEMVFIGAADFASIATANIYHTRRTSLLAAWETPTSLGVGQFPTLSYDGLTLYFADEVTLNLGVLRRESRDDPFPPTSGAAVWAPLGDAAVVHPFFFPRTRELFFGYGTGDRTMPRPDAPSADLAIFRMEVCADAPCPPHLVPCATGVRSADGLHCYSAHPFIRARTWMEAHDECALLGAHLPTIHSPAENALVRTTESLDIWLELQGRTWGTEEPLLYDDWVAPPALPTECTVLDDPPVWTTTLCTASAAIICETELWPTWVGL